MASIAAALEPTQSQSITGVDLSITADVDVDGTGAGNRDFVFHFTPDETPNDVDPNCPYGVGTGINANGCADRVGVSFLGASDAFDIGGVAYTINILGFLPATGGPMVTDFLTMESAVNTADLTAQVVRRSDINVPEPATLALVGISLLGLAATRRRSA